MKVIWSPRAASYLENISGFIAKDSPDAALRVAARLYNRIMKLELIPEIAFPALFRERERSSSIPGDTSWFTGNRPGGPSDSDSA